MPAISSFDHVRFRESVNSFLFGSDLRKGISTSLFVHLGIAAAIASTMIDWSVPVPQPEEKRTVMTFEIQGIETDSEEYAPIPEIAPPTAKEESQGPVVDAPVEEIAFTEGGTGDEKTLWTPEPPSYGNDPGQLAMIEGKKVEEPSPFELIKMPKKGTEPTLVSFQPGSFSGSVELQEAARLKGSGRVMMEVIVGVDGIPIGCSVVQSSGSNLLDERGCQTIMGYRYDPGKDGDGKPVESSVFEVLEWLSGNPLDPDGNIRRIDEEQLQQEALQERDSGSS